MCTLNPMSTLYTLCARHTGCTLYTSYTKYMMHTVFIYTIVHFANIVPFTQQLQNRAPANIAGQIDSKIRSASCPHPRSTWNSSIFYTLGSQSCSQTSESFNLEQSAATISCPTSISDPTMFKSLFEANAFDHG